MAEVAAEATAPMLGLGVAQLFDSASRTNQNILTSILRNLCILIALAIGVHRLLLEAVLSSFRFVPAGSARVPAAGFGTLWELSGQVLLVGARIALPMIAILFIVQITLAFVSRAAPQLQIFSVGFAVATAAGLTTLVLVLPDISRGFIVEYSKVTAHLERLLGEAGAVK
jgi:flagellar biosynthetic protein FliR